MNAGPGRPRDASRMELAERAHKMCRLMQRSAVCGLLDLTPRRLKRLLEDHRARLREGDGPEPDEWPDTAERCRCGLRLPCLNCPSIYELASMGRG